MQIISDQRNSKATALMLLVIAILLVYVLFFHWFVIRHVEYAGEVSDLRSQLNRFQSVAAQNESLQLQLKTISSSQNDEGLFLKYPSFDEAAAALSGSIGDMVRTQADDSCQIVSRQPVRPRVQERFHRVTVNVRMRCDAEDFLQILYGMETSMPLMLVDNLNVIRPRTARRQRGQQTKSQGALDIRFNVSGYLK
ncbi:MAG: type II secretion system protein GspM [Xanthomonadales bacterium]|nr:type II secretion system protein GspM [Xanthomonadales bacterium]